MPTAAKPPAEDDASDWKVGLAAAAIALACIVVLVLLPRLARSSAQSMKRAAPPIALRVVANSGVSSGDGARFKLEDVKGKPVLVDFWAYWCGPCKAVSPIVDRIAKKYEPRGLVTIGVSVDGDDDDARAASKAFGMTYPVLADDAHVVQQEYGVTKLPSLVLIDREGMIVGTTEGLVDEASLEAMVREAL